jgi:hypothetical protein
MRTMVLAGLAAVAFVAAPGVACAQAQDADRFNWHGALARGQTLEVTGIAGSIRAEASTGSEVEVTAVKRGPAGDRREVHIEVEQGGDGVTICAVYGEGGGCHGGNRHARHNETQVEFVARVPAGVEFSGSMVSGDVDVTGIGGHVEVNSVSGDVVVRNVRGTVSAHSVSGDATLEDVDGADVDANTVSGDVAFGGELNARISLSTVSGDIESDFPVTIGGGGRFGRRNMDFTVGSGGARIELGTVSGDFRLVRGGPAGR